MNTIKLAAAVAFSLGVAAAGASYSRTITIKNTDYNNYITNVTPFNAKDKDNNPTSVSCGKEDRVDSGQSCLLQYSPKAKAVVIFKIMSKQKDKQGNNLPDSVVEIYSAKDGTLINKYPAYTGPAKGTASDYADSNNYSSTSTSFTYNANGGITNPNRNDVIDITTT